MDFEIICDGSKATVSVSGHLNATTAPTLDEALSSKLAESMDITFDLCELEYISSAGLRILLKTYKRVTKDGSMRIVNVQPSVMDVLDASGFASIFTIE